jgi:hypothetical protein
MSSRRQKIKYVPFDPKKEQKSVPSVWTKPTRTFEPSSMSSASPNKKISLLDIMCEEKKLKDNPIIADTRLGKYNRNDKVVSLILFFTKNNNDVTGMIMDYYITITPDSCYECKQPSMKINEHVMRRLYYDIRIKFCSKHNDKMHTENHMPIYEKFEVLKHYNCPMEVNCAIFNHNLSVEDYKLKNIIDFHNKYFFHKGGGWPGTICCPNYLTCNLSDCKYYHIFSPKDCQFVPPKDHFLAEIPTYIKNEAVAIVEKLRVERYKREKNRDESLDLNYESLDFDYRHLYIDCMEEYRQKTFDWLMVLQEYME